MPFTNPLVAGTTLIRSAITSPNYVTGVSGWAIKKDGSAEFNNVTVRGTVIAGGGTIVISSSGIHITGTTRQWDINSTNGFMSRRLPDDGTKGQIFDAGFFMTPPTPTPIDAATVGVSGQIYAGNITTGGHDAPFVNMVSPTYTGKAGSAGFFAEGQSANSLTDNSLAIITANELDFVIASLVKSFATQFIITVDNSLQDSNHHYFLRGENGAFIQPVVAGNFSFVDHVTFTHTFTNPPCVVTNLQDGSTNTKAWLTRAINVTTTGFDFFFYSPTGTGAAGPSSATLVWNATEYTP